MPAEKVLAAKACVRCGEAKPTSEFVRDRSKADGLRTVCKECTRIYQRKWESESRKKRDGAKRWKIHRRDQLRHPARVREAQNRHRARHPEKARARRALASAVRRGEIQKPTVCPRCGSAVQTQHMHGHHRDYSKPLDVEWLCRKCHLAEHGKQLHAPAE